MARAVDPGRAGKSTEKSDRKNSTPGWLWPLGVATTSLAGLALLVLRGCWHRRMSWPVRVQNYSYQVCLGCGVKRLFDEKKFCAYGPFRYDLNQLIAWEKSNRAESVAGSKTQRSAS